MKHGFFNKKELGKILIYKNLEGKSEVSEKIESLRKQLSEYLHVANDFSKAEELCSEIINLNPYLPEYLLKRALIRESLGKDGEALKDAALYQHLFPFSMESLSLQARLLERVGKYDVSLKIIQLLMTFDKDENLKESYERVKNLVAKPKKKSKKKSKQESSKQQQAPQKRKASWPKKTADILDETGIVALEEEKVVLVKNTKTPEISLKDIKSPCGKIKNKIKIEAYDIDGLDLSQKINTCTRCALLADYTSICPHYKMFSEKDVEDLSKIQDKANTENNFQVIIYMKIISQSKRVCEI